VYLTVEEEKMLNGEYGEAVSKAMEILVTLGDVYNASKLIKIKSVHMPGSSIVVSGIAGLKFVENISNLNAHFKTFTTLNTAAIDFEKWSKLGIPPEIAKKQIRLTKAYERMGGISCHTCTPYFVGNIIPFKEHCAWGESSAVVFINSIFGARTNREGGPSALAAALTGRVPLYGFHLDENRLSDYFIKVDYELRTISDYGALGYYVGKIVGTEVPGFLGIPKNVSLDELKALGAALASSGAVALFHIDGLTPEALNGLKFKGGSPKEVIHVGEKEINESYEHLGALQDGAVDIACIGCPHCSIEEIQSVAKILAGKEVDKNTELWVLTSSSVKELADRLGLTEIIEKSGGEIICDTCPVLGPMKVLAKMYGYKTLATNSAKLAHYAPGQCNLSPLYGSLTQVVKAAINGRWVH